MNYLNYVGRKSDRGGKGGGVAVYSLRIEDVNTRCFSTKAKRVSNHLKRV